MMIINVLLILFVMTPLIKELLELVFYRKDAFLSEGNRWMTATPKKAKNTTKPLNKTRITKKK